MTSSAKIILTAETISRVDIDFMNNTHFEELDMVKVLGELIIDCQQNENECDTINLVLNEWLDHTQAHFERENTLMMACHFPMYPVHSGEHDRVLDEMQAVIKAWEKDHDIDSLSQYVFSDWPSWFEAHVNSMDMVTAQFAVMHGFDPHSEPAQ